MAKRKILVLIFSAICTLALLQLDAAVFAQGKSGEKKQQQDDKGKSKKDDAKAKDDDAPRNIMGGKSLGLKSSRQEKDSATMGFNGLDPQGKVERSMLAAYSTNVDLVNAKSLVAYAPVPQEAEKFARDGGLKAAPQQTASTDKKK